MSKNNYQIIQEKMDRHPLGAPPHPAFTEILQMIFNPEEARVVANMELTPLTAGQIAERVQLTEAEVTGMLENLADRGLIFSMNKKGAAFYLMVPPMPGIFEFMYMKKENVPQFERMGQLWNRYYDESFGAAMHDERGPSNLRVLTVERRVPSNLEVMPFESVTSIIDNSRLIALGDCQCRQATGKCDAPLDVCLLFDGWADFLTSRGLARKISADEGQDALVRAEKAGLVHTTNNAKGSVPFVCNCCSCCCFMLRGIIQLNRPKSIASSRFMAVVNTEDCDGCGSCQTRCRFDAISIDDTAVIDAEKCYGCGLCIDECPNEALSLTGRPDYSPPPENGIELINQLAAARDKIPIVKK